MLNIVINHDEPNGNDIADYLFDISVKIRDGFTSGPDWSLEGEGGFDEDDEDLLDS